MELYEKNGNILYILNILKKYSDEEHVLSAAEINRKVKEVYDIDIDPRTIRRNINLLKFKLGYDISTRAENGHGYFLMRDPETDFEPGEVRAIIDTFNYANFITIKVSNEIIKKCKNLQNIYENEKLRDYHTYIKNSKTENMEVIKNIEDISNSIYQKQKIQFEYWKYNMDKKLEKIIVSNPVVSPYAIVYSNQQLYLVAIKDGEKDFYYYRLDRMRNIESIKKKIVLKKSESSIQEFVESSIDVFGGKKEEIEAICNKWTLDNVFDTFGKNITIKKIKGDEEHFKLLVDASTIGFKIWAMRNIDAVEVIKPVSLRKEMQEIITNAFKRYE